MKTLTITLTACVLMFGLAADAADFYPISGVTSDTSGTDFYPAANLIQGPGVGFDASAPYNRLSTLTWVTNAPNGGSGDYFSPTPSTGPRLVFDLGSDVTLGEISVWGYSDTNGNGVSEFSLQFATEADGTGGFGTSITFNPTLNPALSMTPRQSFDLDQIVLARYVELTPLDNFFGSLSGGDRVGLSEVAFEVTAAVPEPASITIWSLLGLGLYGFGWLRLRRK